MLKQVWIFMVNHAPIILVAPVLMLAVWQERRERREARRYGRHS